MGSNESAAPLHAWRWKRGRSHPQQGGEGNNNSSGEEEASGPFPVRLMGYSQEGLLIVYWRSWHF